MSIKVTVRLVTWLARIDRAVPNNAAAHHTRPLYNQVYVRSLIVLSHPVLIHLMKDTFAVSCVFNEAQYACSARIHVKNTQSPSRLKCRNSESLPSVFIQVKVFCSMMPDMLVNTSRCRYFGGTS